MIDEDNLTLEEEYKSKTDIKKEMSALRELGMEISQLPNKIYRSLNLPEDIDEGFQTLKRIQSHQARKRQYQYIGKRLRDMDIDPILMIIDDWKNGRKTLRVKNEKIERLTESLIAGDKKCHDDFFKDHPTINIQKTRQLLRATLKSQNQPQPSDARKKLTILLKDFFDND
jgi:ribosome-associated protein